MFFCLRFQRFRFSAFSLYFLPPHLFCLRSVFQIFFSTATVNQITFTFLGSHKYAFCKHRAVGSMLAKCQPLTTLLGAVVLEIGPGLKTILVHASSCQWCVCCAQGCGDVLRVVCDCLFVGVSVGQSQFACYFTTTQVKYSVRGFR